MRQGPALILLLLTALAGSGCGVMQPFIRDYNIVPIDQELAAGKAMHGEITSEMKLSTNATLNKQVNALGQKLVKYLPRKDFDFQFFVVENPAPNAFAIPGARIYVHTGLLKFVSNQHELAGVIGHEIGHVYERHPAKAISRAQGAQILSKLLLRNDQSKWKDLTLRVLREGVLLKYGRDDERESDEIGYYLTRRAGYRTDGLLNFLKKLQKVSTKTAVPVFLQSHPPTPERIARLESLRSGSEASFSNISPPASG